MPKGMYKRKPGAIPKKLKCPNGHDTTKVGSRDPNGDCKICRNERNKKPSAKKNRKNWLRTTAGVLYKFRQRLKHSGWTPELFSKAMKEQGGVCALCKKEFTKDSPPYADHRHIDKKPRGLLHPNCNVAIGFFGERPEVCRMAAVYLELWENRLGAFSEGAEEPSEEEVEEAQKIMGRLGLPKENKG